MRLNRRFNKTVATTLSLLMLLMCPAFFPGAAEAGLFSTIKDKVKAHPVKSALAAVAVGAGAFLAAPYVASAVGAASGAIGAGGIGAAVSGIGAGLAGIGTTIWGGLVAAGGFVTGALGAIGGAIGGLFSGIAGFITGIVGSPLFIPALVIIGAAVIGYILWKKYKRQGQNIGNGSNLPGTSANVGTPVTEITVNPDQGQPAVASEIPPSSTTPASSEVPVAGEQTMNTGAGEVAAAAPVQAGDALKTAHSDYIKAYNEYISKVTNIGGSENPDEELRNNMRRDDAQKSLTAYRDAYNKYITLLRQSNAK